VSRECPWYCNCCDPPSQRARTIKNAHRSGRLALRRSQSGFAAGREGPSGLGAQGGLGGRLALHGWCRSAFGNGCRCLGRSGLRWRLLCWGLRGRLRSRSLLGRSRSLLGWSRSLLGWSRSLLGWSRSLLGWSRSLLGRSRSLLGRSRSLLGWSRSLLGRSRSLLGWSRSLFRRSDFLRSCHDVNLLDQGEDTPPDGAVVLSGRSFALRGLQTVVSELLREPSAPPL
jgi:hypothetical protein